VQHALRAFTPDDLEVVRATAETFPVTELYDLEEELTVLGIGEAIVTGLSPKGIPMPTVRTMMRPPRSLMAQVDPARLQAVAAASPLVAEYKTDEDPVSAKEMLTRRLEQAEPVGDALDDVSVPAERGNGRGRMRSTRPPERDVDWGDVAREGARLARSRTFNTVLRGIFDVLTGGRRR
jgi:hypothetical protein